MKSRIVLLAAAAAALSGQAPPAPAVISPQVMPNRTIAFRILAPKAAAVTLRAGDIQGLPREGLPFTKADSGVWEAVTPPVAPGAYRYTFAVDGVAVMDPRNPAVSESNGNAWSLVVVPGSPLFDAAQVPHGAVASVTYYSTALARNRRMHIYTPPGYEAGKLRYPVFYLLHGSGDCDDSWTSVGRAGFILDNLIAAGKAKPMIVVMPAGHTGAQRGANTNARDEFSLDFTQDIVPYVDKHYRVLKGRNARAIAGLSMGGMQTLNVAMSHLDWFGYVGVFSSGVLGRPTPGAAAGTPRPIPQDWIDQHKTMLDNAKLKPGLKVLWLATGSDDFLLPSTKATVEMLKTHGFAPVFKESAGGHTWLNWRDYLAEFAPMLFR